MKKIIIIFLIVLNIQTTFAENKFCSDKDSFELYECRVKNICEKYNRGQKILKKLKKEDKYQPADTYSFPISSSKGIYTNNMNNIYRCALEKVQINTINQIRKQLIKADKTGKLNKRMDKKLEARVRKIEITYNQNCVPGDKTTIYNKLNVLNNTTYETCKYTSYLQYLEEYYLDIKNLPLIKQKSLEKADGKIGDFGIPAVAISNESIVSRGKIQKNREYAQRVFPIAYNSYSEYENNFPIHILLLVLKEDFLIVRETLYKALQPINQVVYKIKNAQKN